MLIEDVGENTRDNESDKTGNARNRCGRAVSRRLLRRRIGHIELEAVRDRRPTRRRNRRVGRRRRGLHRLLDSHARIISLTTARNQGRLAIALTADLAKSFVRSYIHVA